jgi:hypothetical protein
MRYVATIDEESNMLKMESGRKEDFSKELFKMTMKHRKCFYSLRIVLIIFSILFTIFNLVVLSLFNTNFTCTNSDVLELIEPLSYTTKVTVLLWLLFVFHLIEIL